MITEKQKQIIINRLMTFNPVQIGIFGSYARGENTPNSDIDIVYTFDKHFSLFDIIGAKQDLEKQLHQSIDLVDFKALHPKIKQNICNEIHFIYEK